MSQCVESLELQEIVRRRIDRWYAGGAPDVEGVLAEHPEIGRSKGLVLELVLAEFSLRAEAGDAIEPSEYGDRFPAYRQSIANLLEVEEFLDHCPEFAAERERPRWPAIGETFLGYEIVEPLGRGGLARVFLARETAVGGRYVVIKVSRLGSREAQTLGKLSQASIVPIHSVRDDEDAGWTVICMPLLGVATAVDLHDAAFASKTMARDGRLVARVAAEARPLAPVPRPAGDGERFSRDITYGEAIARLGLELAEGLEAAHAAGILHRDIKPSNVLLAWTGRAMLLDFNLSAELDAKVEGVAGTLAYMAPELVRSAVEGGRGATRRFDPRVDVYSLGVVLYELLSGRLPMKPAGAEKLPKDAYEEWLECKREGAAALGVTEAGIDARLAGIVLKCLAYDARSRYATAGELAGELRAYLGGGARLRRFAKRNRRAILLGTIGLIGSGAALGAYLGTRPTELEATYQKGLGEYERGDFDGAVKSFTRCLELRPGWADAIFGRGQALRRQEKWELARTEYLALETYDRAWSFALAGYCNLRCNYYLDAENDFRRAHMAGLRDIGFLLNYAVTEIKRQSGARAIPIYTEVIEQEPENRTAIRNRGLAYMMAVVNNNSLPNNKGFADAEAYCRLEPDSFLPPYCAAVIYGEAALKEPKWHEDQAIHYLTVALRKGMPLELMQRFQRQTKRLLLFVDANVLQSARRDPGYAVNLWPPEEPPVVADWTAFERKYGLKRSPLAMNSR